MRPFFVRDAILQNVKAMLHSFGSGGTKAPPYNGGVAAYTSSVGFADTFP